MKLKEKYFILIIRRHAGEIDWILPLIYRLTKDIELITLFSDQKSFESLNNNKILYKLWKKKCKKFYVIKKYDRFIYKIFLKTFIFLKLNKLKFFIKFEKFIIKKTFNFNKFINQFKIDQNEIKVILTPIINLSSLPLIFKTNIPNIKLIRFPESQWINPSKKNYIIDNQARRIYNDEFTDFYLINKIQNINFFLGYKINNKVKAKIIYCNFFKYEKWWINKIIASAKIDKKLITVFTRSPDHATLSSESYKYYITTILKVLNNFRNIKVIFKIAPRLSEIELINKILKNFKNINWRIETNHPMVFASKSIFCISILTSACLDCLAVNKKVIEFFDYSRETNKAAGVFSKAKKKWISIYSKKKLVVSVDDEYKLNLVIKNIFLNKNISQFKLNKKQFKNLIFNGLGSNIVSRKINKLIQTN